MGKKKRPPIKCENGQQICKYEKMLEQIYNNESATIKGYYHEYQVYERVNGKNCSKTFQNDA